VVTDTKMFKKLLAAFYK